MKLYEPFYPFHPAFPLKKKKIIKTRGENNKWKEIYSAKDDDEENNWGW